MKRNIDVILSECQIVRCLRWLISKYPLASLSLSFQLRPARGAQPNWWQNIPCSIKTGKFLLVGGSSLSSLPAPPEPAPACLVAEEEAATSDRVSGSGSGGSSPCSHFSLRHARRCTLSRGVPAHNTQILID